MLDRAQSDKLPPPRRSGILEAKGSGSRFRDAKIDALTRLRGRTEELVKKEEQKAVQTYSPLNIGKIERAIKNYRLARGIK